MGKLKKWTNGFNFDNNKSKIPWGIQKSLDYFTLRNPDHCFFLFQYLTSLTSQAGYGSNSTLRGAL